MCHSSNILEQQQQIKIWLRRKLRVDSFLVMLATIQSRTFSLLICFQKTKKIRIRKTIVLPVVLYGRETWSLALKEEQGLRVFENRVLRRIFVLNRCEMTGGWEKSCIMSFLVCTLPQI
jgi:hypothetical protein